MYTRNNWHWLHIAIFAFLVIQLLGISAACCNAAHGDDWRHDLKRANATCTATAGSIMATATALAAPVAATPIVGAGPACREYREPRDGAKRGFLWKQSDTQRGAVALLLPGKPEKFKSVRVWHGNRVFETLQFAYHYEGDGRQTWRAQVPARQYPRPVVLEADGICWKLTDPRVRID